MVKKATRRKRDRKKTVTEDEERALERVHANDRLERLENENLFAVDRERPTKRARHDIQLPDPTVPVLKPRHEPKPIDSKKRVPSTTEIRRISRMAEKIQPSDETPEADTGYDIWGDSEQKPHRKARKRVGERPKYTSHIPAVELPTSGDSYRPSFAAHQAVMSAEVKKEEEKQKRRTLLATVDQTGNDDAIIDVDNSDEDEDHDGVVLKPKERLTEKQRRRRKVHRDAVRAVQQRKKERQMNDTLTRLPALSKQYKREMMEAEERGRRKREEKSLKLPKLGKLAYRPIDKPILLSDELPEALRQLQPQGSGLRDRFDSILQRGVIEPRKRRTRKKKGGKKKGGMKKLERAIIE